MLTETVFSELVNDRETDTYSTVLSVPEQGARFVDPRFGEEPLIAPRVAAIEMRDEFERLAFALSPLDKAMQDDLVQEMCLAALECTKSNRRSYFSWLAGWRAKDYLRWWFLPLNRQEELAAEPEDIGDWATAC